MSAGTKENATDHDAQIYHNQVLQDRGASSQSEVLKWVLILLDTTVLLVTPMTLPVETG